jgi:hypothetical protein
VSAIEIDPIYVDVAIRRWQAFTGDMPVRQSDAKSFQALEIERSQAGLADEAKTPRVKP